MQQTGQLFDGQSLLSQKIHEHRWADVAAPSAHGNAVERRKAHGRRHAAAGPQRTKAGAVAQVTDDHPACSCSGVDLTQTRGDELRHISWSATARRGKLTTRQYQVERDQTILIAIDGGRLMTARIEQETKLDSAVHASLALMSAAARAGDNAGLLVFGRKIKAFLPPSRGREHMDAALEALYSVEPEMIEPSYSHAFEYIAANSKRRSLVIVITDLVDEEGSKELLTSLKLLRPRHLPLVVTIADRDLRAVVSNAPENVRDLFTQSVAEEIMYLREAALRLVESQGGLALDVTAAALAPAILEKYLQVKERGLL